ncbi:MAG: phosphatase PAP2 family protein [Thermodesulfovibrio sp.]|nr:phosphatase PAP2 family protein [Thermodesulfovibrio sp.]
MSLGFLKLNPAFQLNIIFFVTLSFIVIWFYEKIPKAINFFVIYISIALFQLFLSKTSENKIISFIKDFGLPVFSVLVAFETVCELIPYLNPKDIDELLLKIDYLIFGFYPYVYFENFASAALTEFMQISYCFYYFLPFVLGIYLIKRENKVEFYRALFLILLCYYLSYIGYILFPALGPRYSIPHFFQSNLQGLFLAESINNFLNSLEGIKRDAFPSGHVAVSLTVLLLMLKYNKTLFSISLIPVVSLTISTIYCRYHYFVDVVAGVFLTVVTLFFGNLYYNFWLKKIKEK